MPTSEIKSFRVGSMRSSNRKVALRLCEYANIDWKPWTHDDPTGTLFPSDEIMCAVAQTSRTAYSIMHLTKDQLITIHRAEQFDGFEETMANLANTTKVLKAIVQMMDGARGRMIASACAHLRNASFPN